MVNHHHHFSLGFLTVSPMQHSTTHTHMFSTENKQTRTSTDKEDADEEDADEEDADEEDAHAEKVVWVKRLERQARESGGTRTKKVKAERT